jgi:hypothetical protein
VGVNECGLLREDLVVEAADEMKEEKRRSKSAQAFVGEHGLQVGRDKREFRSTNTKRRHYSRSCFRGCVALWVRR